MEIYKIFLPELHNKLCCGSSYGWLFTLDDDFEIHLLNPLSRVQVKLPPHPMFSSEIRMTYEMEGKSTLWEFDIMQKIMLSDDPISNPNFFVMAIVSPFTECIFCRPGDKTWSYFCFNHGDPLYTAAIYDEKIYAFCANSIGVEFNINTCSLAQSVLDIPYGRGYAKKIRYVIKSGEDILYVLRYGTVFLQYKDGQEQLQDSGGGDGGDDEEEEEDNLWELCYRTVGFGVYKLELLKPGYKWIEVKSLGGQALFLDRGHCLSICASESNECKANCIYFLDDYFDHGMRMHHRCGDTGIFNMTDGSIEPLPVAPLWSTPAIWITQ